MALIRTVFPFPARTPSWFAGHMARSLRELPALLDEVDMVIEARDARLPLTAVNPAFDAMLERTWGHSGTGFDSKGKAKKKLVVYTMRDLAEQRYEAVSCERALTSSLLTLPAAAEKGILDTSAAENLVR